LFPVMLLSLLFLYWIYAALYLGSSGEHSSEDSEYTFDENLRYLLAYHFFGLLWGSFFIIALSETTVAGAIVSWYWSRDKKIPNDVVIKSLFRTLRYHCGSLALGSLILATIKFIRVILKYIDEQTKEQQSSNPLMKFICCCAQCCSACFERFIKFLDENAYIEIAMNGESFCASSKRAFSLIFRNILRVATINTIGDFMLFLGKVFISATATMIGFVILDSDKSGDNGVQSPLYPSIIIFIISYAIASAFMAVYEMAIDTILLCFCEDCERNDGSVNNPFYMSDSLRQFVENSAKN